VAVDSRERHTAGYVRRSVGAVAIGLLALGGAALVASPSAFAAGTGYAPSTAPHTGGTAAGLHGKVVKVCALQPGGGTCSATVGNATITAKVSAGTFTVPTTCVVTDADSTAVAVPDGGSLVVAFGIGCYQNGTKVTGSFSPAVTVVVTSPEITSGSKVYLRVGTQLQAITGAQVTGGKATFSISEDPTVEVTAPGVSAVPGATTVHTGEPFGLEGAIADVLVLAGSVFLGWLVLGRRRRRAA
jgi:hypothetical protein